MVIIRDMGKKGRNQTNKGFNGKKLRMSDYEGKNISWGEVGKGVANEIGIEPERIDFIEAKGFLCHELLYLLDGRIEFIFTPWWQLFHRLADILFGVFPVCRWYPPEGTILEWVGYHSQSETKVYRLTITQDDKAVFFVEHEPEAPMGFLGSLFPYNVPCLVKDRFLRPPFEKNKELISRILQSSINHHEQRFEPIATEEAIRASSNRRKESDKGLWEGFIQIALKDKVN